MNAPPTTKDLVVSVVVPVRNRHEQVAGFIDEVEQVLRASFRNYEIIIVDDASTDGTDAVVRDHIATAQNVRLLILSRRQGKEVALTAGLDHAIGDYVVLMSADLRDPPAFLTRLVARAREGCDVVYARKPLAWREACRGGFVDRVASRSFYRIARRLTGLSVPEDASDFLVLSRRAVNSITRLKEHNRWLRLMFAYTGYSTVGLDIDLPGDPPRDLDGDRAGLVERFGLAVDAIVAFSDKPLRYVSVVSVVAAGGAFLFAFAVFLERLLSDNLVQGWASLMVVQLLMFCLLFLFLAVLSEYVSRILVEAKHRPLYYIRAEYGGTKLNVENIVDVY